MDTADFNVKITVRNARLLRAIREQYGTPSAMARETGISNTAINALVTMRHRPVKKNGELTDPARQICGFLGMYPEELWPKHIEQVKIKRASREVELSAEQVDGIISAPAPQANALLLEKWASKLTDRERRAIDGLAHGETFDEIAKDIGGVTRERARQIQLRGLRKLRGAAHRDGVKFVDVAEN